MHPHFTYMLEIGDGVDLAGYPKVEDMYVIANFDRSMDYFDTKENVWIMSIGKNRKTGQVLAASDDRFNCDLKCEGFRNWREKYECLWIR